MLPPSPALPRPVIRLYDGDRETLIASLDRIQKTAARIIEAVQGRDDREIEASLSVAVFVCARER